MASNDGAWEKFPPETGKDQYSQEIFRGAVLWSRKRETREKEEELKLNQTETKTHD